MSLLQNVDERRVFQGVEKPEILSDKSVDVVRGKASARAYIPAGHVFRPLQSPVRAFPLSRPRPIGRWFIRGENVVGRLNKVAIREIKVRYKKGGMNYHTPNLNILKQSVLKVAVN